MNLSSSFGDVVASVYDNVGHRKSQMFVHDMFNIVALAVICYNVCLFLYRGSDLAIIEPLFTHYWTKGGHDLANITHLVSASNEMALLLLYFLCCLFISTTRYYMGHCYTKMCTIKPNVNCCAPHSNFSPLVDDLCLCPY